jgi:hypothetical protein
MMLDIMAAIGLVEIPLRCEQVRKVFADVQRDLYDETENVWIHGMDSSLEFRTGANGKVSAESLRQFQARYEELRKKHPERFDAAFKVVALHHHPAPIK